MAEEKKGLPSLKKKISSYLKSEKGKISKQSMLTVGSVIGTAAIVGALGAKDASAETTITGEGGTVTATHTHY